MRANDSPPDRNVSLWQPAQYWLTIARAGTSFGVAPGCADAPLAAKRRKQPETSTAFIKAPLDATGCAASGYTHARALIVMCCPRRLRHKSRPRKSALLRRVGRVCAVSIVFMRHRDLVPPLNGPGF